MSTLTIPRAQLRDELRPGDQIIAIDGQPIHGTPLQVEAPQRAGNPDAVALVNTRGGWIEINLYPDSQVERDVTIERADPEPQPEPQPEPEPAKPKRTRPTTRRTKYGLTLTIGLPLPGGYRSGAWETDDRDYSIQQAVGVTYCEGPHPMRWKDDDGFWHRGYCIGDQEHDYVIGWTINGPQIPGVHDLGDPHETLDDAWAFLADALSKAGEQ